MGFFNLLMFDHHIPWNPHLKVYNNIGGVDDLNTAMKGELVRFVATSLGGLYESLEGIHFWLLSFPGIRHIFFCLSFSPKVSFLSVPPLLIRELYT